MKETESSVVPEIIPLRKLQEKSPESVLFVPWEPQRTPDHISFYDAPGLGMYAIADAVFWGSYGVLLSADGNVIREQNYGIHTDLSEHICSMPIGAPLDMSHREEEQLVSLVSPCSYCFYHWMLDSLPKIIIAEHLGYRSKYLVPYSEMNCWVEETFELLGISTSRTLKVQDNFTRANVAFIPTYLSGKYIDQYMEIAKEMRHRFLANIKNPQVGSERLYVPRRMPIKGRNITNEEEVYKVLQRYGFVEFQPEKLSIQEQIEQVAHAGVLLGPHGSGMLHSFFMPLGSILIEFFHPVYPNPCMRSICNCFHHTHVMYISKDETVPDLKKNMHDITIDVDELVNLLDTTLK